MKISCVILNYNDATTTIKLINEIEKFNSLDTIIVVDNLSTDDSFEKLQTYSNNRIKVIQTDKNGGYGYGNNVGIRYSINEFQSDYILVSNPDVHFSDECVIKMSYFLENNNEYGIVAPLALDNQGENQKLIAWKLQKKWDYIFSASMIYLKYFSGKLYDSIYFEGKSSVDVDVVPGSLLMVNAEYMLKYGMYDENNFLYSEEEMLALKFKKARLKTRLLLEDTYIHEHSVSISKSFPSEIKKKRMNLNSRIYVLNHYYEIKNWEKKVIDLFSRVAFLENKVIFKIKDLRK